MGIAFAPEAAFARARAGMNTGRDERLDAMRDLRPAGEVRSPGDAARLYREASTPEELRMRETADNFVSILYGMLMKEMDSTIPRTHFLDGGRTEEVFRTFMYDEYAKAASSEGGGTELNHRIYETLYEAHGRGQGVPSFSGLELRA